VEPRASSLVPYGMGLFVLGTGYRSGPLGNEIIVNTLINRLNAYPSVLAAADTLKTELESLIKLSVQVQQIPAPTYDEKVRADWVANYFRDLGIAEVSQDEVYNVYARIPGKQAGPSLVLSAHTDTVFPAETDLTVRYAPDEQRVYGPGLVDNSAGVAALLTLAEKLQGLEAPPIDIWLVANSCEEGLGDLRGMRAAIDHLESTLPGGVGASIVIEGIGIGRIVHRALGSRRFRISVNAPGGHSWSDFGSGSAIHTLVQLANDVAQLKPPVDPRTTFNIGGIGGGTSINTIAQQASLELDLRSESPAALAEIVSQVQAIVSAYQTQHWLDQGIQVTAEMIGDRPAGEIEKEHPLVDAAHQALIASGITHRFELQISSTDANIPLSRGIPSVCVGMTDGGDAHRLTEWLDPTLFPQGVSHLLLLTWWAADWLSE